jgi:hypothetical protein
MEIGILIILFCIYFLPAFIALKRGHLNSGAIFALNLLLGWTLLGWVASLVWACTAVPEKALAQPVDSPSIAKKKCNYCAEEILWAAKVCKHCGRDLPV